MVFLVNIDDKRIIIESTILKVKNMSNKNGGNGNIIIDNNINNIVGA
ncbi:MAG: hypothetical protein BucCj_1580 [Buchnera aphidicola (Ceratovacuna japonica)]